MIRRRDFLKHTAVYAAGAIPTVAALRALVTRVPLALVTRGRSSYAIVVLPDAPLAAQYGAEELQQHLELMSGARLPIVAHADVIAHRLPPGVQPGHLITLGAAPTSAPLPNEGFRLRTQGTQLEIVGGGTRGTLYGCYAFLEEVLGVRWFTPQVTHVPRQPTITVPALDRQDAPAFELRFPHWWEIRGQRAWCARNRINADFPAWKTGFVHSPADDSLVRAFAHNDSTILDARTGGSVTNGRCNIDGRFAMLVPPKDYPQFWQGGGLCMSDPAVVPVVVAHLTAAIQAEPTATLFGVGDDTDGQCTCPGCAAIDAEEGAPSGVLIRLVNAVAAQIERSFPHVLIMTLAYQWSYAAPKITKPRRNVRVVVAPINACVGHVLGTCTENRNAYDTLMNWGKLCTEGQLWYWHYGTNFAHFLQPLPNLTAMCGDYRVFHQLGGTGILDDEGDDAEGGGGSFAELKAYLQAKLMWNPARDGQAVVREFVTGVYGAGAPSIQQWLDALEAEVSPAAGHGDRHAGIFDGSNAPYLPDALVARGATLFDAAERAAAGDAQALEQIRKARVGVEYLQFVRAPAGSPARASAKAHVLEEMRHFGILHEHE